MKILLSCGCLRSLAFGLKQSSDFVTDFGDLCPDKQGTDVLSGLRFCP